MRITRLALLLVAATLATPVSAQSFVGRWTATAVTQGGSISEEVTASKNAEGYTILVIPIGERPADAPDAGPGIEIKLEGDSFAYKRVLHIADMDLVITYTGTVSGDTFTGTAEVAGFSVPYTGVRTSD